MHNAYVPDNILMIENTKSLEAEVKRQNENVPGQFAQPTLDFTTMWGDGARWFVRPCDEFMARTGSQFRNRSEKYHPGNDGSDPLCKRAKIGTYTDLPGNYHVNAQVGVAALNICINVEGVIGFPRYFHSVNGDINVVVPRSFGLTVIAEAKYGVRKNGYRVPNVPIPEFEKYFNARPSKEMREFRRKHFPMEYTWLDCLDGIRTRSKLYLKADNGRINVNFVKTFNQDEVGPKGSG